MVSFGTAKTRRGKGVRFLESSPTRSSDERRDERERAFKTGIAEEVLNVRFDTGKTGGGQNVVSLG